MIQEVDEKLFEDPVPEEEAKAGDAVKAEDKVDDWVQAFAADAPESGAAADGAAADAPARDVPAQDEGEHPLGEMDEETLFGAPDDTSSPAADAPAPKDCSQAVAGEATGVDLVPEDAETPAVPAALAGEEFGSEDTHVKGEHIEEENMECEL